MALGQLDQRGLDQLFHHPIPTSKGLCLVMVTLVTCGNTSSSSLLKSLDTKRRVFPSYCGLLGQDLRELQIHHGSLRISSQSSSTLVMTWSEKIMVAPRSFLQNDLLEDFCIDRIQSTKRLIQDDQFGSWIIVMIN